MLLEMAISGIVEYGAQSVAETALSKARKQEAVQKILAKVKLDRPPDHNSFEEIYVYTLVHYGVYKPEPILNFFRDEYLQDAFRRALFKNDSTVLQGEADALVERNQETKELGDIDYDPRRELREFTAVFNEVVDFSRSPADARRDNTIAEMFHAVEKIWRRVELIAAEEKHSRSLDRFSTTEMSAEEADRTWKDFLAKCRRQVRTAIHGMSNKYDEALYVKRAIETIYFDFIESEQMCLAVIDRAGRGKTNVLCSVSSQLIKEDKPTVLLRGDSTLLDDYGLERILYSELGFDDAPLDQNRWLIANLLERNETHLHILIDGLSEAEYLHAANRSLRNLILRYDRTNIKLCFTCRDVLWSRLGHDLPLEQCFYRVQKSSRMDISSAIQAQLGDFHDQELDRALEKYRDEYDLVFRPKATARNQLRHPLLLRLFCEANQGKRLGIIYGVPTEKTFEQYLQTKSGMIVARLGREYRSVTVRKLLQNIVGTMWSQGNRTFLPDSEWMTIYPPEISITEGRQLLGLLEEEGVIRFRENSLNQELSLQFLFEQLREYLLLKHLSSQMLMTIKKDDVEDITVLAREILASNRPAQVDESTFRFLALIGMVLQDVEERQEFLHELARWDFHTFCLCLSHVPPTGSITSCSEESMSMFARLLSNWYGHLVSTIFEPVRTKVDPWRYSETGELGIQVHANEECREVSYFYRLVEPSEPQVSIKFVDAYPTWSFTFRPHGGDPINLHDPDQGVTITTLRADTVSEHARTLRILNFRHPWFSGVSLDIPERIALYNIWDELTNMLKTNRLPIETVPLVQERAYHLATSIGISDVTEALTLERLKDQTASLLNQFPDNSREYLNLASRIDELERLLHLFGEESELGELPGMALRTMPENARKGLSEQELVQYIIDILDLSLNSYRSIVERNFPKLAPALNTYTSIPCDLIVITDRQMVKYVLVPVENREDAEVRALTVDELTPSMPFRVNSRSDESVEPLSLEDYIQLQLTALGRNRPWIQPVTETVSLDKFFSLTAANDLVYPWLADDFKKAFVLQHRDHRETT